MGRKILGLALGLLLLDCKREKPVAPTSACAGLDTMMVTYGRYVAEAMRRHCTSCHGGSNPSAGVRLDSYQEVRRSAETGKWYQVMENGSMPPTGRLDDCTLAHLRRWIELGYPQ
ncbi:MAG: cytochrome c [Bacteroidia bacterium]|nr:hypothetical protein [Bacteroidia bacterium]MDW8014703.1 cytochrome c [Bacteroidia bacterium]